MTASMSSDNAGNWCLIESDPGVFTELIQGFGVKGVQCEEVFDLESLQTDVADALGFIFLYKWKKEDHVVGEVIQDSRLDSIFFAKQVITNACATLALINMLMNVENPALELGESLSNFKSFCSSFDPYMKGLTLSNSADIRRIHNSFTCNTLYELDDRAYSKDEDNYHFVSYVPINGRVYELDGLQEGPIDHGPIPTGMNWTQAVQPIISAQMSKAASSNISFNLMAVVPDRLPLVEQDIKKAHEAMETESSGAKSLILSELENRRRTEESKQRKYRAENNRRRHNYLPFLVELLSCLAKEDALVGMVQKAAHATRLHREAVLKAKASTG